MKRHVRLQRAFGVLAMTLCCLAAPLQLRATPPCTDSVQVHVQFDCTYAGLYRPGEPYDYVTVTPTGAESFADAGVTVEVTVRDCQGYPLVGVVPEDIVLWSEDMCMCLPDSYRADAPTDMNGRTTFRDVRFHAGGSASALAVYIEGIFICEVPVKLNSPAQNDGPPSCSVDVDAETYFANRFATEAGDAGYGIESDLNEDGFVDLTDLAVLARFQSDACASGGALSTDGAATSAGGPTRRTTSPSRAARIGIFFDANGTQTCTELARGETVDYWVLALVEGSDVEAISGAEFRIDGLPANVVHTEVDLRPHVKVGDDVRVAGISIAWSQCQRASSGVVELARGTLTATEDVPATTLRLVAHAQPSSRLFPCPTLARCEFPTACDPDPLRSSKVCSVGLEADINATVPNECSTATTDQTWGQIKRLFR